jgi:hypothetical protein
MATLAQIVKTPMSIEEVRSLVDCPVIMYAEFARFKTLPPACIYLFLTSGGYGHYCAVMRKGAVVECFDSYGIQPESEHSFVRPEVLKHLGERNNFILELCRKKKWSVVYNSTQLQSWNTSVATCGRHCVERVRKQEWDIGRYAAWLKSVSSSARTTPDTVVSYLVH